MVTIEQFDESLKLITNALNKACTSGMFSLNDAYMIKNNILKIDNIDNYNYIYSKLNDTCVKGIYSLDEAYIIYIAMDHIKNYNNLSTN